MCRKCIKIGTGSIFYVQLIYSRIIRIINVRKIIFRYELVHIPSAGLDDDGSMGTSNLRYRLKKKITSPTIGAYAYAAWHRYTERCCNSLHNSLPVNKTGQNFMNGFLSFLRTEQIHVNVYLVYNFCYGNNIKNNNVKYQVE